MELIRNRATPPPHSRGSSINDGQRRLLDDLGDLKGKKVLVRVDFNVPLDKKTGAVKNDRRIRGARCRRSRAAARRGARSVIAMSHLGRPEKATAEEPQEPDDGPGRRSVRRAARQAGEEGRGRGGRSGGRAAVQAMKPGEVLLLENLRFDPREQKNDPSSPRPSPAWATPTSTTPSAPATTTRTRAWSRCRPR